VTKRILASALWFVSLSSLGGFAEVFFGVPADLGGYLGIAVAVVVLLDPSGLVWRRRGHAARQLKSAAQAS
jgi:hypothetical protein